MKKILFGFAVCSIANNAAADEYNLFNPVPDDKMRGFTTERPSKTDSPFTIDSGHLVIETSLFSHTNNSDAGTLTDTNIFGAGTTLRLGITQSDDFQVVFDTYKDVTSKTAGVKDYHQGYGDTTLRWKHNFLGNDSGDVAVAVVPYIKLPTNQDNLANKDVEGGIELPFNVNYSDGWNVGGVTQFNLLKDQINSGYYGSYVNSLVVGKSFTPKLSGYTEVYTLLADTGSRDWQNTLDFGVVYAVSDNIHIDTGVNFGISKAADDLNYFVGLGLRF